MGYIANYGYEDGSGTYVISIDTGKCNGCGECIRACAQNIFDIGEDDYGDVVAFVRDNSQRELRYLCSACKSNLKQPLPCTAACSTCAIVHSW